jgi:O-antigen/teichoic acid export membrane protein
MTTRLLGAEQFGLFIYLITISAVISAFFEMGLDLQIVRLISPNKNKGSHFSSISLALRLLGVLLIVVAASVLYVLVYQEDYDLWLYIIGITQGIFLFILSHLRAIFRSLELLKYEAISIAVEKLSIAVLGFIILLTTADLLLFFIFYNVGSLVAVVTSLYYIYKLTGFKRIKIPTSQEVSSILKPAMPFAVLNIIQVTFTRLGTLLLERLSGNIGWVGFHNAGARFADAFVVFPNTIMAAVYPVLCRVHEDIQIIWNLVQLTSRMLLALAVPVGTAIFIASYEFTMFVFGTEYIEAYNAIGVFGLTLIATSQVFIVGSVVSATGNQYKANYMLIVVFVLSLLAYLIFIPRYGYVAAAWITLADQSALFVINLLATRKYYRLREYGLNILRGFVFPVIAWYWYLNFELDVHPVILFGIILGWNFLGTLVTGLVRKNDVTHLIRLRSDRN